MTEPRATPSAAARLRTEVERSAAASAIELDDAQRELLAEIAELAGGWGDERTPSGVFIHGPAGRGKTWLASQIFDAIEVPASAKRRVHFHTFFQELQRRFGAQMTARAAIESTVAELLDGARVFFFDELHVHDPGGASLLNRLIAELVERRIPTLFTSNYEPEGLLANPVFHHVVEPSIRLIREHFAVRTLDGGSDYRTLTPTEAARHGFASGRWIAFGASVSAASAARAAGLTPPESHESITVLDGHRALRALAVRRSEAAQGAGATTEVWFDFADLLESPSIAEDYLDLAAEFDRWVLVDVPPLSQASREARQRFVALLDVLVHADLPLTVLARTDRAALVDLADPPADLFRTASRLALLRDGGWHR
ncbi:cell division protein ZapE [Leucobacter sp. USCH14]|uniref:cell division protein ZapE n=1 Tax=Leucobacter sp. USCH14 TaxID=3024838 RepID=UPI003099DA43